MAQQQRLGIETAAGQTSTHTEASRVGASAYAQVLVQTEVRALGHKPFTYAIPQELEGSVSAGSPVLVPFGQQPAVPALVVALTDIPPPGVSLKPVADVLDEVPLFDAAYLDFLRWVGHYYATSLVQVLACALPAAMLAKIRKTIALEANRASTLSLEALPTPAKKLVHLLEGKAQGFTPRYLAGQLKLSLKALNGLVATLKSQGWVRVHSSIDGAPKPKTVSTVRRVETTATTPRQQAVLDYLGNVAEPMDKRQLETALSVSSSTLKAMEKAGTIAIEQREVFRNPLEDYVAVADVLPPPLQLNEEQQTVVEAIDSDESSEPHLIYGITGSGKTEVYMALAEQALRQGQSVLVLVPEIALTAQIAQRFLHRFGSEVLALWHSGLSDGERADTWRRIRTGQLRLIIGARSAIFMPLENLGLIVMDEEHDGSYKQDSPAPRYDAKTLAVELAKRHGAKLVLGSATPDVAQYEQSLQAGRVHTLTQRYSGRLLPDVTLVDMREEQRGHKENPQQSILSLPLQQAMAETLANGEQSLILINRRGFHTLIQCRDCGHAFRCAHCDVSLTFHRQENVARCHHCGYTTAVPQYCPQCAGMAMVQTGTGTQRVEEAIAAILPEARMIRLDSDVTQRKDSHRTEVNRFSAGEADILVGTQMVAKGLDIENVTLVGVIQADSSFFLPDYRSTERGFQLLTQVAGRAGRGSKPGRVILQTMDPYHPVIQFARDQDYLSFYHHELETRQNLLFPPFSQLFRMIVMGEDEGAVRQYAQALAAHLTKAIEPEAMSLLGPAPCVVSKLRGQYRFHLLVKNTAGKRGHYLLNQYVQALVIPQGLSVLYDVDAQSLL